MSEKFQPGEEIFDETEGHGRKGPGIVAEDEGTEGHMPRIRLPLSEDDDAAEGHAYRPGRALPEDDTEGHVFRH